MKFLKLFYCFIFLQSFLYANAIKVKDVESNFITNSVEQLDFLAEYNLLKKDISNDKWYIFFAGAPLDTLKFYIDKTSKSKDRKNFLKELNKKLIKLNNREKTSVYVAFTDYNQVLKTTVYPEDVTSLSDEQSYIKSLIKKKDYTTYSPKELEKLLIDNLAFSTSFKNNIKRIFDSSILSQPKYAKKNMLMPFTNFSVRQLIKNTDKDYKGQSFFTYALYTPKLEVPISVGKFKSIYNKSKSSFATSKSEKKIERVVNAIETYYYGDFKYKKCQELLVKYQNKPILKNFPEFRKRAEENPCILNNVVSWGDDIYGNSEWFNITQQLIVIPLYAALAIPASEIIGIEAVRQFSKKKITDASKAAVANIVMQTIFNFYFGKDDIINESNTELRWEKAALAIDKQEFSKAILESILDLSTRQQIVLECLNESVKYDNIDWDNLNPRNANIKAGFENCISGIFKYLIIEKIKDKALGYLFDKMKKLAQRNPKRFLVAWRQIQEEYPGFKKVFRNGYEQYKKDVQQAIGYTSLSKKTQAYLEAAFNVDVEMDTAFKEFSNLYNNKETTEKIRELAIAVDSKITNNVIEAVADGTRQKIYKQGLNISLNVNSNTGSTTQIKPTIIEELGEGVEKTYRLVFTNDKKTLSQIEAALTTNRKYIIELFEKGQLGEIVAVGNNADQFLGIKDKKITVSHIELRSLDDSGNIVSKKINPRNVKLAEAGSDLIDDALALTLKSHPNSSKLGLNAIELDNFKALLNTKTPNSASDIFNGLKSHLDAGTSFENMQQMISGLKNDWGNFSDGSKWVFNYTSSSQGLTNFAGKKIRFELPTKTELGLRRIDVADVTNPANPILYEFKSVQTPFNSTYATQFVKDLSTANSLDKIKWMFDGSKVTTSLNKTQILNLIENSTIPQSTINKFVPNGTKVDLIDLIDANFNNIFKVINL